MLDEYIKAIKSCIFAQWLLLSVGVFSIMEIHNLEQDAKEAEFLYLASFLMNRSISEEPFGETHFYYVDDEFEGDRWVRVNTTVNAGHRIVDSYSILNEVVEGGMYEGRNFKNGNYLVGLGVFLLRFSGKELPPKCKKLRARMLTSNLNVLPEECYEDEDNVDPTKAFKAKLEMTTGGRLLLEVIPSDQKKIETECLGGNFINPTPEISSEYIDIEPFRYEFSITGSEGALLTEEPIKMQFSNVSRNFLEGYISCAFASRYESLLVLSDPDVFSRDSKYMTVGDIEDELKVLAIKSGIFFDSMDDIYLHFRIKYNEVNIEVPLLGGSFQGRTAIVLVVILSFLLTLFLLYLLRSILFSSEFGKNIPWYVMDAYNKLCMSGAWHVRLVSLIEFTVFMIVNVLAMCVPVILLCASMYLVSDYLDFAFRYMLVFLFVLSALIFASALTFIRVLMRFNDRRYS